MGVIRENFTEAKLDTLNEGKTNKREVEAEEDLKN